MRTLVITTLLAGFASWASAQKIGSTPAHVPAGHPLAAPNAATPRSALSNLALLRSSHHSGNRQSPFYPYGFFSDLFYPDNDNLPPESSPPSVQPDLLLQALSGLTALSGQAGTAQPPAQSDARSQLIELQGDRYVSLISTKDNASEPTMILKNESAETHGARELAPVTILFRDGHQEDIRDYTIADGVIYARGNFYRDGYWNKKIKLSTVDLPETVKSNEARGIRFVLPGSSNEVITRP